MKRLILLCCLPLLPLTAVTRTFYSDHGWGYYYWLFGPIGPSQSEGMAAAGFSSLEYRGYVQMGIGGWPGGNVTVNSLQLRLRNNTGGNGLQIDINRVASSTPSWTECGGTAPIYLINQPVIPNAEEYTYFDLTGTQARDDFLNAWQSGASWFGFGLKGSRGGGEPCMHFFYAFWADNYYDAALIIDYVIGIEEEESREARPALAIEPNPFRHATRISVGIRNQSANLRGELGLRIYDTAGRLVNTLVFSSPLNPNPQALEWNGTDQSGQSVPEGVYLAVLKTAGSAICRKIVKIE